jgi:hypothetical protein
LLLDAIIELGDNEELCRYSSLCQVFNKLARCRFCDYHADNVRDIMVLFTDPSTVSRDKGMLPELAATKQKAVHDAIAAQADEQHLDEKARQSSIHKNAALQLRNDHGLYNFPHPADMDGLHHFLDDDKVHMGDHFPVDMSHTWYSGMVELCIKVVRELLKKRRLLSKSQYEQSVQNLGAHGKRADLQFKDWHLELTIFLSALERGGAWKDLAFPRSHTTVKPTREAVIAMFKSLNTLDSYLRAYVVTREQLDTVPSLFQTIKEAGETLFPDGAWEQTIIKNKIKPHYMAHLFLLIEKFGAPINVDTARWEGSHKDIKKAITHASNGQSDLNSAGTFVGGGQLSTLADRWDMRGAINAVCTALRSLRHEGPPLNVPPPAPRPLSSFTIKAANVDRNLYDLICESAQTRFNPRSALLKGLSLAAFRRCVRDAFGDQAAAAEVSVHRPSSFPLCGANDAVLPALPGVLGRRLPEAKRTYEPHIYDIHITATRNPRERGMPHNPRCRRAADSSAESRAQRRRIGDHCGPSGTAVVDSNSSTSSAVAREEDEEKHYVRYFAVVSVVGDRVGLLVQEFTDPVLDDDECFPMQLWTTPQWKILRSDTIVSIERRHALPPASPEVGGTQEHGVYLLRRLHKNPELRKFTVDCSASDDSEDASDEQESDGGNDSE